MSKYKHEVIICIVNSGFSDEVMDAAREFGARGGTVIRARGTANAEAEKLSPDLTARSDSILPVRESLLPCPLNRS